MSAVILAWLRTTLSCWWLWLWLRLQRLWTATLLLIWLHHILLQLSLNDVLRRIRLATGGGVVLLLLLLQLLMVLLMMNYFSIWLILERCTAQTGRHLLAAGLNRSGCTMLIGDVLRLGGALSAAALLDVATLLGLDYNDLLATGCHRTLAEELLRWLVRLDRGKAVSGEVTRR